MSRAPLPVTVIGGYLGAGKTTLVNHLLRQAVGRRIAVAVNDFGALPIDRDLIEGAADGVLSLAGGCVCCSFGSDLVAGLMNLLAGGRKIDHIVIEASGVALPAAIARSVALIAGLRFEAVVVLADAETVRARADDPYMGDTILRQLAEADIVLLNKTDLVTAEALARLAPWLARVAPKATVIPCQRGAVAPDLVLGLTEARSPPTTTRPHSVASIDTADFALPEPVDAEALAAALASPTAGLVRAKGWVIDGDGTWRLLQVVGQRHEVSEASRPSGGMPGLVVIAHGRRVDRADIESRIRATALARQMAEARHDQHP